MSDLLSPDRWASSSHENMSAHLTAPFAGGARTEDIDIDSTAIAQVARVTREPILLAAPLLPLGAHGLRLKAALQPGDGETSFGVLDFAPYSEAGAFLPLHMPSVNPTERTAAAFEVSLSLFSVDEDGVETPYAVNVVAGLIRVQLLEGILGRLIYAISAEKHSIRRQAREISAMRFLEGARADALDKIGSELGVPRLPDRLTYDTASGHIVVTPWTDAGGNPIPTEPDDNYRNRLSLYRPLLIPTKERLAESLNGPGQAADPNHGLLSHLGLTSRFKINEDVNPFAVAIHLVSTGPDSVRFNFITHIREVYLIWPEDTPAANLIHQIRALPPDRLAAIDALRASLRLSFTVPVDGAFAPLLASALDRVGRCRRALGLTSQWQIVRAQDLSGSRYELGLGADLLIPPATDFSALAAAVAHPPAPITDPEIAALIGSMTPQPLAVDPNSEWFFGACGLKTVHQLDSTRHYLSHLPVYGLLITGDYNINPGVMLPLEAHYNAPGDPGPNVVIQLGMDQSLLEWTSSGQDAWNTLSAADGRVLWGDAHAHIATDPVLNVFRAAGLPAVLNPDPVVSQLKVLPPELITTVVLPPTLGGLILGADPGAANTLRKLMTILTSNGLVSVLPLTTIDLHVALVIGAIGLPAAGVNLSDRRATGFRWYTVKLQGGQGYIKPIGSRTTFTSQEPGLNAIVSLGYARKPALNDSYEFSVDLPDGTLLNLSQYEFLMNLLGEVVPMGILVNTRDIRTRHVDLDGDGTADPLPPNASRTFRPFRQRRLRGLIVPPLSSGSKSS